MKKILILLIISSSFFLVGCRIQSQIKQGSSPATASENQENKDFGPYSGKEYSINQTKDLYDFQVTLNKITIGNQNFGRDEDGYASIISTGYASQWIIGDFTLTAKFPTNLSTLQFGIGRKQNGGGTTYNESIYQGKITTGAAKFGFLQNGLDVSMTGNESKNVKVLIPLLDQFSGNGPYTFHVADSKYATDTTNKWMTIEFDLSQYLRY